MVTFNTRPPNSFENGETSVPPPARPSLNGARALTVLDASLKCIGQCSSFETGSVDALSPVRRRFRADSSLILQLASIMNFPLPPTNRGELSVTAQESIFLVKKWAPEQLESS
jgi:hypothetical protein